MKTKINVTVFPNCVDIDVKRPDGSGVNFALTHTQAVQLADRLNAALDDPADDFKVGRERMFRMPVKQVRARIARDLNKKR